MVDPAFVCFSRVGDLSGLFDLGGIPGESLLAGSKRGELSFSVLFAGVVREFTACDLWAETGLVAFLAFVFAGAPGALGARRISAHLLLLSRRLLQSVLGRSTRLRRW